MLLAFVPPKPYTASRNDGEICSNFIFKMKLPSEG
jgi:hypothetical protein